ncbi:hypothetical protein [Glaciibacter superstes]|uniref:hypothetical protein n=1 Tax=Glaciibacter superstes TaxID=501023 RepID=UPI0003B4E5B5|nr:hypothetical protein [Glaciibacter superstes]
MRSKDERKADFERREAERKAKLAAKTEARRVKAAAGDARRAVKLGKWDTRKRAIDASAQMDVYLDQQRRLKAGEVIPAEDVVGLPQRVPYTY